MNSQSTYQNLSDSELYTICKRYGLQTLDARRKFAGTLPEVFKRRLYRRRGYASIYEFAAKLAGMNQNSVDIILRLAKKLEDKPKLKEQLESGSQGWSKIERVAYIATPETDENWAEKMKTLSKPALEEYLKHHKKSVSKQEDNVSTPTTLTVFTESQNEFSSLPGQTFQPEKMSDKTKTIHFKVSPQLEKKFRLFKHKLEKERKETLSFAEALEVLLDGENAKTNKAKKERKKNTNEKKKTEKAKETTNKTALSRYIPVHVRRIIKKKYKGTCAFPGCCKAATSLHHTQRFALEKSHDPNKIIPLCDAHEQLVHSGMIENEEDSLETWGLRNIENGLDQNRQRSGTMEDYAKNYIDQLVWLYR